ncbi:MAG: hypothetical protein HQK76_00020 [Desulfobacterales bacterium]|nr:hypothetical protein [Desulfobacterales bacterium]
MNFSFKAFILSLIAIFLLFEPSFANEDSIKIPKFKKSYASKRSCFGSPIVNSKSSYINITSTHQKKINPVIIKTKKQLRNKNKGFKQYKKHILLKHGRNK